METTPSKPIILYAEDDHDDFESVREALEQISSRFTLINAKDGTEVVSHFEKNGENLPNLVVLDLNMPVMDGKEVLTWLKKNEEYSDIPVMIFTTSSREEDVKLCQKHNCSFFRKPTLYRDLLHIAQVMLQMCERGR